MLLIGIADARQEPRVRSAHPLCLSPVGAPPAFSRGFPRSSAQSKTGLQLLEELASRAGDENPAWDIALSVLHALHDPGRLATLGTIGALRGVHYLLAVGCLGNLCGHGSPSVSRHKSGIFSRI